MANIEAKEVVIAGTVTGNIECTDRVDIRGDAVLTGDVVTQRISIDVGAMVKGSVEVRKLQKSDHAETTLPDKVDDRSKPVPPALVEPQKAAAAAAMTARPAVRVAGSQVLYQEQKAGSR